MKEDDAMNDFVDRCMNLQNKISVAGFSEESARVWISVMNLMMIDIVKSQKNPNESLSQLIEDLRKTFDG